MITAPLLSLSYSCAVPVFVPFLSLWLRSGIWNNQLSLQQADLMRRLSKPSPFHFHRQVLMPAAV
jgi:hypothetical protein